MAFAQLIKLDIEKGTDLFTHYFDPRCYLGVQKLGMQYKLRCCHCMLS